MLPGQARAGWLYSVLGCCGFVLRHEKMNWVCKACTYWFGKSISWRFWRECCETHQAGRQNAMGVLHGDLIGSITAHHLL